MEDVNSWMIGTHEFLENWATMTSNDSTVFISEIFAIVHLDIIPCK